MLDKIVDLLEHLEKRYNIPFEWLVAITGILLYITIILVSYSVLRLFVCLVQMV